MVAHFFQSYVWPEYNEHIDQSQLGTRTWSNKWYNKYNVFEADFRSTLQWQNSVAFVANICLQHKTREDERQTDTNASSTTIKTEAKQPEGNMKFVNETRVKIRSLYSFL